MTRLTKADEKRATEALAKCAAATKNIDDPKELNEKAFDILYKELGDKPELLKRACEGYNSAKSVYRLGAATDDTRGDNFGILDAPALAKRASEKSRASFINKAASAYGMSKAQFSTDPVQRDTMRKSASAERKEEVPPMRKLSSAEVMGEATAYLDDVRYSLSKVASEYKRALGSVEPCERRFINEMDKLEPAMRKQASEILSAYYGAVGDKLVSMYNAARPMNKVASYAKNKYKGSVAVPDEAVYNSAWDVLTAHIMVKEAAKITAGFAESAMSAIKDVFAANNTMHKEASVPQLSAIVPSMQGADNVLGKAFIGSEMVESALKLGDKKTKSDLEREITTTYLLNALKNHSIKRAFMHTATDATVARYPLHQVTAAFNDALAELPVHMRNLPPSAFSSLLKSRTIARLGRGGATSASDVDQIQSIQQAYGRIRPEDITSTIQRGE